MQTRYPFQPSQWTPESFPPIMRELEKRRFGQTELQVSVLGLGSHELSQVPQNQVGRLLYQTLDEGVNVIDTAECYGRSEELIGRTLGARRKECYLFTKCGHASDDGSEGFPDWHPRLLEMNIEQSLRRLKTDYLDLVQLHSCSYQTLQRGEVIEVLQRAQQAGKTRYIGYSGDRRAARYAVECGAFDSLQTSLNIVDQEAIDDVLPLAVTKGMGIIVKRPLANVVWKRDHNVTAPHLQAYWHRLKLLDYDFLKKPGDEPLSIALRFTLSAPGVDVILIGTTRPGRFAQNKLHLEAGPLPASQYEAIRQRWKEVTWWRKHLPGSRWGWHAWT